MTLTLPDSATRIIRDTLAHHFGPDVRVWAFGARARGGTVGELDLYAEVSGPRRDLSKPRERARRVLEKLLLERVELTVRHADAEKTPLDQMAKDTGIPL